LGRANEERQEPFSQMSRRYLTRDEFERVVSEALESLPARFAKLVENVVISAEDEPAEDDREGDADADSELLVAA
jgi:predicted Zn-dependent protease with MMP-like domain